MEVSKRSKSGLNNKVLSLGLFVALMLLPGFLFAQSISCQDSDPRGNNTNCPLDTWVWVLVAAALLFGAISIYRKNKIQASVN